MEPVTSHRRIARNTFALYVRGIISVAIALYSSRVVIDALGVDDYGVYGVVGGFVAILAFINSAMSGATSRFITYEMGLGESGRTRLTFANTLTIHVAIAAIIIIVCELVGVWFINTRLNIPAKSMYAANWVFQLSVLTAAVQITQVPYTALIISHERMNIYAYMEIANAALKLLVVYFLIVIPGQKLIIFALLTALSEFVIAMAYRLYCLKHFTEARVGLRYNKEIIKPILKFSVWDLYGNMAYAGRTQGTAFIINIFFGVAVNGAATIATQMNGAISRFSNNVATAVRPQIIKNYARQNWQEFQHLIEFGSQASFILVVIMVIPLIVEAQYVIELWLGKVPEYVIAFLNLILLGALFNQINTVIIIAIHATGKIKGISFISGTLHLLVLPVIWILFSHGCDATMAYVVLLISAVIILITNSYILKYQVRNFNLGRFCLKVVVLPLLCVPAVGLCLLIHSLPMAGFVRLLAVSCCSVISVGIPALIFILTPAQKERLLVKIKDKLHIKSK